MNATFFKILSSAWCVDFQRVPSFPLQLSGDLLCEWSYFIVPKLLSACLPQDSWKVNIWKQTEVARLSAFPGYLKENMSGLMIPNMVHNMEQEVRGVQSTKSIPKSNEMEEEF